MSTIKLFESKKIRSVWDVEKGKWYFSIVDVVEILTGSPKPRKYWSVLKTRLKKEDCQLTTNCSQLKMQAADGKLRKSRRGDANGSPAFRRCNKTRATRWDRPYKGLILRGFHGQHKTRTNLDRQG